MSWIILDIATAALDNAADYLDKDSIEPPGNYKAPEAVAKYREEEFAKRLSRAGLDFDLARISGIGYLTHASALQTLVANDWNEEAIISQVADLCVSGVSIVTYNGHAFDLPMLMRRARYLGVPFPALNIDRYKSPHRDLCEIMSNRDPSKRRPLGFYGLRLGLGLTKALSGEEEAQVFTSGRWDDLAASLRHDVETIHALAKFAGVIR